MKLFVYASLKKAKIQEEVLGHKAKDEWPSAHLTGYRELYEKDRSGNNEKYPTLHKDKMGSTEGELFDVTDKELKELDQYENSAYKRIPVKLTNGEAAETYVRKV